MMNSHDQRISESRMDDGIKDGLAEGMIPNLGEELREKGVGGRPT